ncbi:hypothetical protein BYT27DRAFT_7333659 [Phlegmacium glaucopus]|nr:hypothetical protein BYT27DRAFT_7333659 [Phlegmacium glaucopus]
MSSKSVAFALLIGIDTYPHVRQLKGCVNDCNALEAWLKESFDDVHQMLLTNDKATRANILTAIKNLAEDSRIQEDDLILIFFAGHGAEVKPLEEWKLPSKRKIQMRIPYDFKYSTEDENHQAGILDRDLSRIIAEVAKISDNIVVILDSCHSASGTRREEDGTVRGIDLPDNYAKLASLAKTDFTADIESNASRASSTTPTNHILLAACREDLKTRESWVTEQGQYRGIFSHRLLKQLRGIEIKSTSVTYEELILSLGYESPYPHCDGVNKDRIIFSMDRKDKVFLPIEPVRDGEGGNGILRIQLGLCHDIKPEDRFLIFTAKDLTSAAYVGEAKITDARNLVSYLKVPPDTPNHAFAVRAILSPHVSIAVPQSELNRIVGNWKFPNLGVKLVDASHKDPKLVLQVVQSGQDCVGFNFSPPCHGLTKTFLHPSPLADIDFNRLFQQMGHFYDYLECTTPDQKPPIEIRLVTLRGGCDEKILKPDDAVNLPSDNKKDYGYKITNTSDHPIYFSLFYFDMSKFSIDVIYNPPTVSGGEPSPCLEVGESKTIGYGNEGDDPWFFILEKDGLESELIYLKLFFSAGYLDLLHIRRDALFLPKFQHRDHRGARRRSKMNDGPHLYMNASRGANKPIGTFKIPLIVGKGSE